MKFKITLLFTVLTFCLQQTYAQCDADFEEKNGIAVIEAENKVSGSWSLRNLSGASGGQALYFAGSNQFNNPGTSAITYKLRVNSPGTYRVIMRTKIGVIATDARPTSEHNDTWLRVNGTEFYGQLDNSIVWPQGSGRLPIVAGSSGDGWLKAYTDQLDWNWRTLTNDGPGHEIFVKFNSAGVYNVQISGRSKDHIVDKIVLYREGVSRSAATSAAETTCDGTSPPPTENVAPTVNITNPGNGQSFDEGSSFAVNLSANDSDGSITKHVISVNGNVVDTDGSSYTPYQFSNAQPGSYAIRATVTDNNGATGSSTVNITVNEENVPPPPPAQNMPPTVNITNPGNGQSFDEGSSFAVNLTANDSDGNITKHVISVNGNVVDTDGSSYTPHQLSNVQPGSYAIMATVTDNDGATASSTVNITVIEENVPPPPTENNAPSVSFSNLTNGQSFEEGSNISIGLNANDSDGTVVLHKIYVNNTLVDTDGSSFTPHVITGVAAGDYSIRATVTDNLGKSASATVNVEAVAENNDPPENQAPTVSITTLTDGQEVSEGSNVSVGVSANDVDGSITKYQIFVNGLLVDTDGTTFTPHPINDIKAGNYEIKVIVTDNMGATGSTTINISVANSGQSISFSLVNATSNAIIGSLADGATISASKTQGINIVADIPSGSGSVELTLSGAQSFMNTENVFPYALFGDLPAGDYFSGNLKVGSYTLTATAFSNPLGAGDVVASNTINFSVASGVDDKSAILFPNPVKVDGKVSLKLPEGSEGQFSYAVVNASGVQLEKGSFRTDQSQKQVDLQLTNVGRQVRGVYYLTLISTDSRQIIPVIRE